MLAKSRKLNLSKLEVRREVRTFNRLTSPHLLVKYSQLGLEFAGSVVVSKQVSVRATVRNAVKRKLYQELEKIAKNNPKLRVAVWVNRPGLSEIILSEFKSIFSTLVNEKS